MRHSHLFALVVILVPTLALAAPTVSNISPRGLQAGGATTLTIDGAGLLPDAVLVSKLAIARQSVREGASAKRVEIEVSLDAATPPGIYLVYVATKQGISAPIALGVDALPQLPHAEKPSSLPVALHGSVAGSNIVKTSFAGKAGQRAVMEVEARRLGSALNPVLRLYDARKNQLAWTQGAAALSGDARLDVTLPRDGEYLLELHDALYRGGNPGFYRLKLGDLHYADMVLPLAARRGEPASLEPVSTSLPVGTRLQVETAAAATSMPAPWPASAGAPITGAAPRLVLSDMPEVLEATAAEGALQTVEVPAGINGRLASVGEEDRYQLTVKPGMKLRFDVLAARAGAAIDGVLAIRNLQGVQLATGDDRPGTTDPGLDFTVPAKVESIVVALKDLQGRGGPNCVYRIAVTQSDKPDFSLVASESLYQTPQEGNALLRVRAVRAGYNGVIRLSLAGAPQGMELSTAEIPAGVNEALVTLSAGNLPLSQMLTQLAGEAAGPLAGVRRIAELPETAVTRDQPWLRSELALAVTPPAPVQLVWEPLSAEQGLPLGGTLAAKLTAARREGVKGPIRLSLVTSQNVPKKKENNRDVDDVTKAIRVEGTPLVPIEQTAAELKVLVPADLPKLPYDLVFKGELLSLDGKNVLATVYTDARRLSPQPAPPTTTEPAATLVVFEDQADFAGKLTEGGGTASLFTEQKHTGAASLKVTPDQKFNPTLPGLSVKIRENPAAGEYRYLRFAWKKQGGQSICLQLNHDGQWGPVGDKPAKFRYHAGPGPECYGASLGIDEKLPAEFTVVTRDLFADFGEFTWTGLALSPVDGEFALFDHIYLARSVKDLDAAAPK